MANESKQAASSTTGATTAATQPAATKRVVKRREFEHEMTDAERWALDVVRKTKNGLTQVALMIQEGDEVSADVIDLCNQLQGKIGRMMFH